MLGRLTPRVALLVTLGLFAVAWIENTVAPWAPFYIVYVVLTIWLPLHWRSVRLGSPRAVPATHWLLAVACGIGAQIALSALLLGALPQLLAAAGVSPQALASPYWNLPAAHGALFERLAPRWHTSAVQLQTAYLAFLVLWAGFGEEVYFRGYLHAAFSPRWRTAAVVLVSAALFGMRHALQLSALGGDYPWGAAAVWSVLGMLFGIILSWLYLRTRSLWPPILAHYVFNGVPLALGALGGG